MRSTSLDTLADDQLVEQVKRLVACERRATAALIRALVEFDVRRLYLREGCSSLFTYCTRVLHLSEASAYNRIESARAVRRFPAVLDAIEQGSLTLTSVRLLAPHLTGANHAHLIAAAAHNSRREVEQLIASVNPRPDVAASIRRLPAAKPQLAPLVTADRPGAPTETPAAMVHTSLAGAAAAPLARREAVLPPRRETVVTPLAPERYKLQVTLSRETHDKLRRAQALLRHGVPSGDPAVVLDRALTLLVEHLEKQKCAATTRPHRVSPPATASRHIPAAVRREVWARDDGRCAFAGSAGRCQEEGFLEFHHVVPYAAGGGASVSNIELRCRAHNACEADLFLGAGLVREIHSGWSELGPDRVGELGARSIAASADVRDSRSSPWRDSGVTHVIARCAR